MIHFAHENSTDWLTEHHPEMIQCSGINPSALLHRSACADRYHQARALRPKLNLNYMPPAARDLESCLDCATGREATKGES